MEFKRVDVRKRGCASGIIDIPYQNTLPRRPEKQDKVRQERDESDRGDRPGLNRKIDFTSVLCNVSKCCRWTTCIFNDYTIMYFIIVNI